MIARIIISSMCEDGFLSGWKRAGHIENGHPKDKSTHIERVVSNKHPHNSDGIKYTFDVYRCDDCGLYYIDHGLKVDDKYFQKIIEEMRSQYE